MTRELTSDDALNAVWGGSARLRRRGMGRPRPVDGRLGHEGRASRALLGGRGRGPRPRRHRHCHRGAGVAEPEIRRLDYVRALQLVAGELNRPVVAVMTAQNGSSTTLNGWIQSAILG